MTRSRFRAGVLFSSRTPKCSNCSQWQCFTPTNPFRTAERHITADLTYGATIRTTRPFAVALVNDQHKYAVRTAPANAYETTNNDVCGLHVRTTSNATCRMTRVQTVDVLTAENSAPPMIALRFKSIYCLRACCIADNMQIIRVRERCATVAIPVVRLRSLEFRRNSL